MSFYERVATLPLEIDSFGFEQRERETSSDFTRVTTVILLGGGGELGAGEDVTYNAEEHDAFLKSPPTLSLPFEGTFDEFSTHLDESDLFPTPAGEGTSSRYRRWGFESAALDLALQQSGTDLASSLGKSFDPVRFVVSTRLGAPPRLDRIDAILDSYPETEFKLDPTSEWTQSLIDELATLDRVRILDLKGAYEGTSVDQPPDPDLYEMVISAFPEAIVEDPGVTEETRPILDAARDRLSWDAPIDGVSSLDQQPLEPAWVNIKPSRFGTVRSLFDTVEHCLDRGIPMYGGGQFELAVGREHVQALAATFYPDSPNDVAPTGYNDPTPSDDLQSSPLKPSGSPSGLTW